jgi:S1-C subfamily serine protease
MRQYRRTIIEQPQPASEPAPQPDWFQITGQKLRRFYNRFKPGIYMMAGILIMLAGVFIYSLINPAPQPLTQKDIDKAVEHSLDTLPPKPSFASEAYHVILPSVVRITANIYKPDNKLGDSLGTGVVIDQKGTIVTCLHVVDNAMNIFVMFADGTRSTAQIINKIPENDLAILQPSIIPDDLVPATLTSSNTLNIGDEVFAVGNPFGISNSLTAGVVSGLNRTSRAANGGQILKNLIQFDAAVNPGNSGGPLVNRNGEVVGIVTGLLNPNNDDVFIGIGYAIPMETAVGGAGSLPF